jgi:hypothetical protein
METERVKESRRPPSGLTRLEMTAVTRDKEALQPPCHVVVDLPKFGGGIARAEVGAPATQHRVELRDSRAQVPVARPVTSFTRWRIRRMARRDGQRWR